MSRRPTHRRFCGGAVWRCPRQGDLMLALSGEDTKMMLLAYRPDRPGGLVATDADGKWLYTHPELQERLKGCRYVGAKHELYRKDMEMMLEVGRRHSPERAPLWSKCDEWRAPQQTY